MVWWIVGVSLEYTAATQFDIGIALNIYAP